MDTQKNKKSYLDKKSEQLQQWDKIIDKLIKRANNQRDDHHTELRHHIVKLQVKKARTEVKLIQLKEAGKEKWDVLKTGLEKNWLELREAFSKASK